MSETEENTGKDEREDRLRACEEAIGYQFRDRTILRRGLTHSSAALTRLDCNERLEFLGDAVLGLVICEHLFGRFPERREGQLTQQKSHLVSRTVCTEVGARLGLHNFIIVGKGLSTIPDSLKAAAVESLIAAIYLDGGLSKATDFILRAFASELKDGGDAEADNYKSLLQEETQKHGAVVPRYAISQERGPDHAREFQVSVEVGTDKYTGDWRRSKKQAEQDAAMKALDGLSRAQAETADNVSTAGNVSIADNSPAAGSDESSVIAEPTSEPPQPPNGGPAESL